MIMKKSVSAKYICYTLTVGLLTVYGVAAQTEPAEPTTVKKVNFGYSQNPKTKTKAVSNENPDKTEIRVSDSRNQSETVSGRTTVNREFESRSAAVKTLEVVKRAKVNAVSPTEIYKLGVGDVLFISLQNAPSKSSTYFTVLNDGSIDYPLAGEMISVNNLTTEEVEDLLKEKIKLYENPQISVKVREYTSHAVTVFGTVEKAGELYLKRDAMPLYTVRAEAVVQSKADWLTIKRADSIVEQIDLKDSKSDDVLIFPGDILEFKITETNPAALQFYFIGGNIVSAGQKDFHAGLTLTQAILASGGLRKNNVKTVTIRRKNQAGMLSPIEFDLNAIKNGKQPDPLIKAGDTIEIVN